MLDKRTQNNTLIYKKIRKNKYLKAIVSNTFVEKLIKLTSDSQCCQLDSLQKSIEIANLKNIRK